ncbi:MAG: 23S rRNA (uracil(1939)-C(5))-methyltransferase RlmD [Bacteroidetes bacterium]|nr:23S rRNA (uracil(1939)-C(5))-methyltransferase RlmD [Bacteroidota bacterium]
MKQVKVLQHLEIVKVADKGLGMAYQDGKVIFVERTVPGDVVDAQLFKNKKNFAMGYPLHFSKLSEFRIEPYCSHFGTCGGCRWQNLPYAKELEFKTQLVADALQRLARIREAPVLPAIGAEPSTHYRNKLEYTFSNRRWLTREEIDAGADAAMDILGYHVPNYHDKVLDIETCYLQPDPSNAIRLFVRDYARQAGLSFYDLGRKTGVLRNLQIRNNRQGEVMIILVVSEFNEGIAAMLQATAEHFPQIASVHYALNTKSNSAMNDVEILPFSGAHYLTEHLGNIRYRVGPHSFFQTNPAQAEVLVGKVRELAQLRPDDRVYDLYTGLGSIALYVADACREVVGVESVEGAVADARINASDNGIENCRFFSGDMTKLLTPEFLAAQGKPDVIITDPPRAGMTEKVNQRLLESGARRIVYVSCNPVSQARDLEQLCAGYTIAALQPVDMFPRTYHVENIAVLDRIG